MHAHRDAKNSADAPQRDLVTCSSPSVPEVWVVERSGLLEDIAMIIEIGKFVEKRSRLQYKSRKNNAGQVHSWANLDQKMKAREDESTRG